MNGIQYFRRRSGMKVGALAKIVGHSDQYLRAVEHGDVSGVVSVETYERLSTALDASIDELLRNDWPDDVPESGNCGSNVADPDNAVTRYRNAKGISYAELGNRLGGQTRQNASHICSGKIYPRKAIEKLAKYEGVTVGGFLQLYGAERLEIR